MKNLITADYNYVCQGIPERMMIKLIAYRDDYEPVGDFLRCVISNDLMGAVGHADSENIKILHLYVQWLYNEAPALSHGSAQMYKLWLSRNPKFVNGLINK